MCLSKIITVSIIVLFISSGVAKSNNCNSNDGSLFLSNHSVYFESAHTACKKSGGTLAQLSNENFSLATDLVFQCQGPYGDAWIKSWNSNTNHEDCLTLYVGNTSPGGSVAKKCSDKKYALCNIDKSLNTNDTQANVQSFDSLSESSKEEGEENDLSLDSSFFSENGSDNNNDYKRKEAVNGLTVSDSQYLEEEMSNSQNFWNSHGDKDIVKLGRTKPKDLSYLWGTGGDIMPDIHNNNNGDNNDDTSSKTMSVDDGDEGEMIEEEEQYSQFTEEEPSPLPSINKVQQDISWNSAVKPLADTDLNKVESDDDHVVKNTKASHLFSLPW